MFSIASKIERARSSRKT